MVFEKIFVASVTPNRTHAFECTQKAEKKISSEVYLRAPVCLCSSYGKVCSISLLTRKPHINSFCLKESLENAINCRFVEFAQVVKLKRGYTKQKTETTDLVTFTKEILNGKLHYTQNLTNTYLIFDPNNIGSQKLKSSFLSTIPIYGAFRDLVAFVKNVKKTHGGVLILVKLQANLQLY